jgi:membrane-associated phospholipid phosphatase
MPAATDPQAPGALERADLALGRKLASRRRRRSVRALAKVGKLADQEPLYGLGAALLVAGLVKRQPRLAEAGLRIVLSVGAADLMKSGVKRLVRRTRPNVMLDEDRYHRGLGGSSEKPEQSFPSGHMAGATATAAALHRAFPKTVRYSLPACGLVAWSRLTKGAHWPSDVAAGAAVGLVGEAVVDLALRRMKAATGR